MAATPQSQQRCVFVGNIPYDATEEQLVQICEEVGPVVSFRLVVDRETGKPKGYGFCEYKDEETALSARRNLQGYEINGRQLRVDFAENGKNVDRATGRAGPGTISNPDPQKQSGGVAVPGYSSLHQPMGDSVAAVASTVMEGALGATHGSNLNPTGWQGQILSGNDPLTSLLAKMSRSQLTEVISELKAMTLQNKEQVRQLLLAIPNLPRALFQAQIMLGMVTPQMLQMANNRQTSAQSDQPLMQTTQTVSRLPPLSLDKVKVGYQPHAHESQASASNLPTQYAAPVQQIPAQSQIQRPQLIQNQVIRQNQPLQQSKASPLPHARPQPVGARPYVEAPMSSSFRQQEQPSSLQNIIGQPQLAKASVPTHSSGVSKGAINVVTPMSTSVPVSHVSARQSSMADETVGGKTQVTQLQLPSDLDSTLLQQVLNLTPEQLSSLPLAQQQQVIQLQQMLSKVA